jgi:pyruvate formate lyase activating enzyme
MEEIFTFLYRRKSLLDGVVITGGEPTLHEDLPEFCNRVKSMGYSIKLDTNGSRPKGIQTLIDAGQIDYMAMDVKTLPENYAPSISQEIDPHAIMESISLIRSSGIPHEFRTTCVRPFVNRQVIEKISEMICGADLFAFQQANITDSVLAPEFFRKKNWKFSTHTLKSFQTIAAPSVKKTIIR